MSLYDERLKRTLDAIHMDPVDKIPFSYSGPAYVARREGLKMSTFVSDFAAATEASVKFCQSHPGIDSIHSPVMAVGLLPMLWLTQVRRPGVELPDDELWQLDEQEIISYDDYQKILDMGYGPWLDAFLKEKLDDPMAKMVPFFQYWPTTVERMTKEAQVPIMNYSTGSTAFEGLCGGRTLMSFFDDIAEEPELIKQVMDNAHEYNMQSFCAQLDATHPPFVWVGGWRAAPSMLSHDTWMDLVWPYLKPMILACVERNVVPVLHFDSCWDREIETLKELPAKTRMAKGAEIIVESTRADAPFRSKR